MPLSKICDHVYLGAAEDDEFFHVLRQCPSKRSYKLDCRALVEPSGEKLEVDIDSIWALASVVDACVRNGIDILVYCGQGLERSPLVVAMYLCRYHGMSLEEAYGLIESKRPGIFRRDVWVTTWLFSSHGRYRQNTDIGLASDKYK